MVAFNGKEIAVSIPLPGNHPSEEWLNMATALIDVMQMANKDMYDDTSFYYVLELLRQLLPDMETAKKMEK